MVKKKEGVYLQPLSDQAEVDWEAKFIVYWGLGAYLKLAINFKKLQNKFAGMKLKLVYLQPRLAETKSSLISENIM